MATVDMRGMTPQERATARAERDAQRAQVDAAALAHAATRPASADDLAERAQLRAMVGRGL